MRQREWGEKNKSREETRTILCIQTSIVCVSLSVTFCSLAIEKAGIPLASVWVAYVRILLSIYTYPAIQYMCVRWRLRIRVGRRRWWRCVFGNTTTEQSEQHTHLKGEQSRGDVQKTLLVHLERVSSKRSSEPFLNYFHGGCSTPLSCTTGCVAALWENGTQLYNHFPAAAVYINIRFRRVFLILNYIVTVQLFRTELPRVFFFFPSTNWLSVMSSEKIPGHTVATILMSERVLF